MRSRLHIKFIPVLISSAPGHCILDSAELSTSAPSNRAITRHAFELTPISSEASHSLIRASTSSGRPAITATSEPDLAVCRSARVTKFTSGIFVVNPSSNGTEGWISNICVNVIREFSAILSRRSINSACTCWSNGKSPTIMATNDTA